MPSIALGRTRLGVIIGVRPCCDGLLHREVEQRELQQRPVALEVEEAGAGHLGAALDVDGAEQLAQLEVVARREALGREVAWRADLLEDGEVLLAADGGLEVDEVRHLQPELVDDVAGGVGRALGVLDLVGECLRLEPSARRAAPARPSRVASSVAFFSAPCSGPICLPSSFCWLRSSSKAVCA